MTLTPSSSSRQTGPPPFRANSVPSHTLLHAGGTTPRSRLQQQISTSYSQQTGPNAMYVLYEQGSRQASLAPSCGSAMDCESPCHSTGVTGVSSGRKGVWAANSSSSSSLTSPPHSMSPSSNFTLPPSTRVPSSSSRLNATQPEMMMRTSSSSHQLTNSNSSCSLRGSVSNNNPGQVLVVLDSQTPPQILHAIGRLSPLHSSAFTSRRESSGSSGSGSGGQLNP